MQKPDPYRGFCSNCSYRRSVVDHHIEGGGARSDETFPLCSECHEFAHRIGIRNAEPIIRENAARTLANLYSDS